MCSEGRTEEVKVDHAEGKQRDEKWKFVTEDEKFKEVELRFVTEDEKKQRDKTSHAAFHRKSKSSLLTKLKSSICCCN